MRVLRVSSAKNGKCLCGVLMPHPRRLGGMGILEVVDAGVGRDLGGVGHDGVDPAAHLGEQIAAEHVGHDQIAQLVVLVDLGRGEHGGGSEGGN
jgi:hypothetical protein